MNLDELISEYAGIEERLADPSVHADQNLARKLGKRYAELRPVVETHRELAAVEDDLAADLPADPAAKPAGKKTSKAKPGDS